VAHPETAEPLSSSSILVGTLGPGSAFQAFCSTHSLHSFHIQERLAPQFGALSNFNLEVPNPPLNSDPACIAFRSLSAFRYPGSAQSLGAGGAG